MKLKKDKKDNSLTVISIIVFSLTGLLFLLSLSTTEKKSDKKQKSTTLKNDVIQPSKIDFMKDKLSYFETTKPDYEKDNISIYLHEILGKPLLTIKYKDSANSFQKKDKHLVFVYLKNHSKWLKQNKKHKHILITNDKLTAIEKNTSIGRDTYFNIPLNHPFISIDNIKKLEYVRYSKLIGRSEAHSFTPKGKIIGINDNGLDKITIKIKNKAFKKLQQKREDALKVGILISNANDYVKADIDYKNKIYKASVRLKGDWTDHLEDDKKWSYKVSLDDNLTILGMRKFAIQHPKARNFSWEWLFNKVIKENKLVAPKYSFVNAKTIVSEKKSSNEIDMGIMAIEQGADKILIESNKRREGIILCFDETMIWNAKYETKATLEYKREYIDIPKNTKLPIKLYNQNKTLLDPNLKRQFEEAKNLLTGLQESKLKISEAFDAEKLAMYLALSNLFGGHHGLSIKNLRIYFNPVSNKLEPISFDSNSGIKIKSIRSYPVGGIKDDNFKKLFNQKLELVSSEAFINGIYDNYKEELNRVQFTLNQEFTNFLDLSILEHNANMIKKKINPKNVVVPALISFGNKTFSIEVENITDHKINVKGLVLKNGKYINEVLTDRYISPNTKDTVNFKLKSSFDNAFVSKKNKEGGFRFPKDLTKVELGFNIIGVSKLRKEKITPFVSNFSKQEYNITNLFLKQSNDYIKIDESAKRIVFSASREIFLTETLILPSNYSVIINKGFILNFKNEASLISYSPVYFNGTKNNPIKFYSSDNTGGGVLVLDAKKESEVKHAEFSNLSNVSNNRWVLSGAVNFYNTTVRINNSKFQSNNCEDALNLINSKFIMSNSLFKNTFSDAFDGDYVEGTIINTNFINSGNDAIDVSGSNLELNNVFIENPSDKAISAGEQSIISGKTVNILGGEIGLVSKDNSEVELSTVKIIDTKLGISAFQKKSEYGPASIQIKGLELKNILTEHLIEDTSKLLIDGVTAETVGYNVINKMYGKEYGKSSK